MSTAIKRLGCTSNCSISAAGGILVCSTCGWDEYMNAKNKNNLKMKGQSYYPAFPVSELDFGIDGIIVEPKNGLTKREYFAIKAMQGFLANPSETEITSTYVLEKLGLPKETKYDFEKHYTKYVAKIAVSYADALIAELDVEAIF